MVSYIIQRMILSLLVGADLVVGRVALSVTSKQKQRLSRETIEVESSAKRTSRNEVLVPARALAHLWRHWWGSKVRVGKAKESLMLAYCFGLVLAVLQLDRRTDPTIPESRALSLGIIFKPTLP